MGPVRWSRKASVLSALLEGGDGASFQNVVTCCHIRVLN
jgi:hypothetical protein